jgi:hypothetical protein
MSYTPISNYQDVNVYAQSNSEFYSNSVLGQPINTDWGQNGRVFFDIKKSVPSYDLYKNSNQPQAHFENTLNYTQEGTPLSATYFSKDNLEALKKINDFDWLKKIFDEQRTKNNHS